MPARSELLLRLRRLELRLRDEDSSPLRLLLALRPELRWLPELRPRLELPRGRLEWDVLGILFMGCPGA